MFWDEPDHHFFLLSLFAFALKSQNPGIRSILFSVHHSAVDGFYFLDILYHLRTLSTPGLRFQAQHVLVFLEEIGRHEKRDGPSSITAPHSYQRTLGMSSVCTPVK